MQLTGLYILLSLVFVGLNIDTPQDLPGLYGSIFDATSMRNFWSKFSHRLVYRPLSTFAAVIIDNILWTLPRGSLVRRYALNTTVFIISGAVHVFLEGLHGTCGVRYTMFWFSIQPLAFVLEAAVQYTGLHNVVGKKISRVVGYCWVFMWLFCSIPKRAYPKMTCATASDDFCINRALGKPWEIWYHSW
jgi:glyoxylate utilization-related uncharacterized protein